jgi:hypothetical protein
MHLAKTRGDLLLKPQMALHAEFIWMDGRKCPGGSRHYRTTPGAVIQRLPEEQRAILRKLKSADIENLRPDALAL